MSKKAMTRNCYTVTIAGIGGLLMDRMPDMSTPKAERKDQSKIDPIERERLIWKEKIYQAAGMVIIPSENVHECLKEGAKYWGSTIPGEGKKTYTDVIKSAVVVEDCETGIKTDDAIKSGQIVPLGKAVNGNPSKGKSSGTKVYKIRPLVTEWQGSFKMIVLDERLTPAVLETIITYAGAYKGVCNWRPKYGRFSLENIEKLPI